MVVTEETGSTTEETVSATEMEGSEGETEDLAAPTGLRELATVGETAETVSAS